MLVPVVPHKPTIRQNSVSVDFKSQRLRSDTAKIFADYKFVRSYVFVPDEDLKPVDSEFTIAVASGESPSKQRAWADLLNQTNFFQDKLSKPKYRRKILKNMRLESISYIRC